MNLIQIVGKIGASEKGASADVSNSMADVMQQPSNPVQHADEDQEFDDAAAEWEEVPPVLRPYANACR